MVKIAVADATLYSSKNSYNFKEKLEIARQLEKLNVDVIEIPAIENEKTDVLFIKTVASFIKHAVISVACGKDLNGIDKTVEVLSEIPNSRIRLELPISTVGMEYTCHKKGDKMLAYIKEAILRAKDKVKQVELKMLDATRAEDNFALEVASVASDSGVDIITVCDNACETLSDDFAVFVNKIASAVKVPVGVYAENSDGLGLSKAVLSLKNGAKQITTSSCGISLKEFASLIKNVGDKYGYSTGLKYTELNRIVSQIEWVSGGAKEESKEVTSNPQTANVNLDSKDSLESVKRAVNKLGYDLSEEDCSKVYEEFLRVASKKNVGTKELDAIVASVALQVPETYKLVSYIVNNGNTISSSAQIELLKGNKSLKGVCIGDGPIDAAFRAIEQIIGHHYELDDFQIQSVTEGKEAVGLAVVKLRANGKIYSGNGISTDIIGSSIRAYISAVNKIVYQEK